MKDKTPILKVMISSSVYGAQSLLRQIYATLLGFGYDVICSPVGTLTVNPTQSNLENCLRAVRNAIYLWASFVLSTDPDEIRKKTSLSVIWSLNGLLL